MSGRAAAVETVTEGSVPSLSAGDSLVISFSVSTASTSQGRSRVRASARAGVNRQGKSAWSNSAAAK